MKVNVLLFINSQTFAHQYTTLLENKNFLNNFAPKIFTHQGIKFKDSLKKYKFIKFKEFKSKTDKVLSKNIFFELYKILVYFFEVFFLKRHIYHLLKLNRFDLVLIPGDRELPPTPLIINYSKKNKIPVVILNETNHPDIGGQAIKRDNREFICKPLKKGKILNLIVSKFFEKNKIFFKQKEILFSSGWRILSLYLNGIKYNNPWINGGSSNSYITLSDENIKSGFIKKGIKENRIIIVGDSEQHLLFSGLKNKSNNKKKLSRSKQFLLLFSIPNDYEEKLISWEDHCLRINTFIGILLKKPIKIFFSLHPKSIKRKKKYFEDIANISRINFLDERISKYFCCFDIYVCSLSSTIKWSKITKIPTLNINPYNIKIESLTGPNIFDCNDFVDFEKHYDREYKKLIKKKSSSKVIFNQNRYYGKDYSSRLVQKLLEISNYK